MRRPTLFKKFALYRAEKINKIKTKNNPKQNIILQLHYSKLVITVLHVKLKQHYVFRGTCAVKTTVYMFRVTVCSLKRSLNA